MKCRPKYCCTLISPQPLTNHLNTYLSPLRPCPTSCHPPPPLYSPLTLCFVVKRSIGLNMLDVDVSTAVHQSSRSQLFYSVFSHPAPSLSIPAHPYSFLRLSPLTTCFVVKGSIGHKLLHVDVSTAVQEQPEVLRGQSVQSTVWDQIQDAVTQCLEEGSLTLTTSIFSRTNSWRYFNETLDRQILLIYGRRFFPRLYSFCYLSKTDALDYLMWLSIQQAICEWLIDCDCNCDHDRTLTVQPLKTWLWS